MAIWESLLAAATGGALGIAGSWVTQRHQTHDARIARQQAYEREDQLRALDDRRTIYSRFIQLAMAALDKYRFSASAAPDSQRQANHRYKDAVRELLAAYADMRFLAHEEVIEAAKGVGVALDCDDVDEHQARLLISEFNNAGRKDLGLEPLAPLGPWPLSQARGRSM